MNWSKPFACGGLRQSRVSRRHLLKVGGMGLLGLTMPTLLRAEAKSKAAKIPVRAKAVIFLYQFGGPSDIDMFDMTPSPPEGIRGPHKPLSSRADGIMLNG